MPKYKVDKDRYCMICLEEKQYVVVITTSTYCLWLCLDCLRAGCRAIGEKIRDEK